MLRLRRDSHKAPPSDDADDPLTSKPETLPGPPISFDSRRQFRRNVISLSKRCLITSLSLSLLVLGLRIFSQRGELSHPEQRGFNAITILLGAFTSLGLGSMLGHLGSMLRWRLLARKKHKMQDVWEAKFLTEVLTNSNGRDIGRISACYAVSQRLSSAPFFTFDGMEIVPYNFHCHVISPREHYWKI